MVVEESAVESGVSGSSKLRKEDDVVRLYIASAVRLLKWIQRGARSIVISEINTRSLVNSIYQLISRLLFGFYCFDTLLA